MVLYTYNRGKDTVGLQRGVFVTNLVIQSFVCTSSISYIPYGSPLPKNPAIPNNKIKSETAYFFPINTAGPG